MTTFSTSPGARSCGMVGPSSLAAGRADVDPGARGAHDTPGGVFHRALEQVGHGVEGEVIRLALTRSGVGLADGRDRASLFAAFGVTAFTALATAFARADP